MNLPEYQAKQLELSSKKPEALVLIDQLKGGAIHSMGCYVPLDGDGVTIFESTDHKDHSIELSIGHAQALRDWLNELLPTTKPQKERRRHGPIPTDQ